MSRFLFFKTLFRTAFCGLVRNEAFRATFEKFQIFLNTAKPRASTGGTIRSIIVAEDARIFFEKSEVLSALSGFVFGKNFCMT